MGCKIRRCIKHHSRHYCRLCEATDSNHFSSECPNSRTLYHGTQRPAVESICSIGLKESADGRLGPGVYFTKTFEDAEKISRYRYPDGHVTVVTCQVYLGNHICLKYHGNDRWQSTHDSACSIHPSWQGIERP